MVTNCCKKNDRGSFPSVFDWQPPWVPVGAAYQSGAIGYYLQSVGLGWGFFFVESSQNHVGFDFAVPDSAAYFWDRSRIISHTARPLDFGRECPASLSHRPLAYFVGSAGFPACLPCPFRKLSVSYFYTAGLGGDPLLLCEDGALTFRIRGGHVTLAGGPGLPSGRALGGHVNSPWHLRV